MTVLQSESRSAVDKSPTPEFDQRCDVVLIAWGHGQLPFRDAVEQVGVYREEAIKSKHLANQACAEHTLGILQGHRGNSEDSIAHFNRALILYRQLDNPAKIARIELNLGINYFYQDEQERGLELMRVAATTAQKLGDLSLQIVARYNEATFLIDLERYSSAYQRLEAVLILAKNWEGGIPSKGELIGTGHSDLALLSHKLGWDHLAWEHIAIARRIAEQGEHVIALGHVHLALGELFTDCKVSPDPTLSPDPDTHFRKAITLFCRVDAEAYVARALSTQARSLATRGERVSAVHKFRQAMLIFSRLGMIHFAAQAAEAQLKLL